MMNLLFPKKIKQLAELTNPQPFDHIDMFADRGIGFVCESGRDDSRDASLACRIRDFSRINPVASDDPENLRRLQPVDLSRDAGGV